MGRRLLTLACCVLLAVGSVVARSQDSNPQTDDPISGTWTGQFVLQRDASNVVQVTLELKFDGKREVSGTFTGLPTPGEVKSGTFDPKSGALKLGLGKQDEPAVLLVLEGTVSNGTAAGHFTGEESGDFKISRKG